MVSSVRSEAGGESIVYTDHRRSAPTLRFLHYNDVYHVEAGSREPVGGISRFNTVVNFYRHDSRFAGEPNLITLFSGDAFNPSLESSVSKGSHMIPVLNSIKTDVACVGNHDLDFGVAQFQHLAKKCSFPWLLANVLDPALGVEVPLGNAKKSVLLSSSKGVKVGVIGLVEREWLDTINSLPPNLEFRSATQTVMELAPKLREQGANMIIALTHARDPNDIKLASETPPGVIDIILGGHDHFYESKIVNGTHILRSGTDFKQLSYIQAWPREGDAKGWDFEIVRRDITSDIPEDSATKDMVDKITSGLTAKLDKPIGHTATPLDARFTTARLKESNMANFVCDLMKSWYSADCAIMAGGTIRGDQIYPPGILRLKDIMNCFPFEDPVVVVKVTGHAILSALENGVSTYPALEGRFPQVSGIKYAFDPNLPPGKRVLRVTTGDDKAIDLDKTYILSTRDYMCRGKDGFTSLLYAEAGGTAETIVSEENGILISMMLRQYFMSLKVLGRWKRWSDSMAHHLGGVHKEMHQKNPAQVSSSGEQAASQFVVAAEPVPSNKLQRKKTIVDGQVIDSESEDEDSNPKSVPTKVSTRERELIIMRKVMKKWRQFAGLPGHADMVNDEVGKLGVGWSNSIAPRLEGRIKVIGT